MSIADCAALVERGDPDRFRAAMTAPVAAREGLFPLYAFNVEVTRAPWASQEPMICEMRLQWWTDLLGQIADGAAIQSHEVATPLAGLVRERGLDVAPLQALVAARRWDIYRDPFESAEEFDRYLDASAAGLMWASAQALGAPAELEPTVRDIGWAGGLAALFRAVPALEARGRFPLHDGRPGSVAALAHRGLERLSAARRVPISKEVAPALRAAWRAEASLKCAVSAPDRVVQGALEESPLRQWASLSRRVLTGRW
ncbi:squalene/phytoene synthase family protein [Tropicimonas sp. TH_r6]|uniref:squalene/phytoene synthase family protein n=1 Tax=Tropicimonas sp. TH_r6 TaxID=3082085 RepID=UPI0029557D5B|nr:squalene/phytoene synthase family protein [Tropicimonas sp. TH_r6]MDV7142847.1 squalene/phytoene synthase family protein [Tropicimonas sp. TH_r6]